MNDQPKLQPTQRTISDLKEKHPKPTSTFILNRTWSNIRNYSSSNEEKIKISREAVRTLIRKQKKLIKHGVDKLRYEHLWQLFGFKAEQNPDEVEFGDLFCFLSA